MALVAPTDLTVMGDGMDRRQFITRGSALTAGAWLAPSITSVAHAQTTGTPLCTGFAYDLRLEASGLVTGTAGPVRESSQDEHHPKDCFANVAVGLPGQPALVVAETFCVENEFQAPTSCRATAEWVNLRVDLASLNIPVSLQASVLRAEAVAACGQQPTASSHIAEASITVSGNTQGLAVAPPPNTTVALPKNNLLDVTLILNEQHPIPNGIAVNAVHLTVVLLNALGSPLQHVDLVLSHAEADVHGCP